MNRIKRSAIFINMPKYEKKKKKKKKDEAAINNSKNSLIIVIAALCFISYWPGKMWCDLGKPDRYCKMTFWEMA